MGYSSMISLLAGEQERGNLRINPVFAEILGEKLSDEDFKRIERVFNVRLYQANAFRAGS